eukprot:2736159-Rhodomonas_salina.1
MLEASMAAAAWAAPVAVIASEPVAQSSSVVEPEAVALKPELELTDEVASPHPCARSDVRH